MPYGSRRKQVVPQKLYTAENKCSMKSVDVVGTPIFDTCNENVKNEPSHQDQNLEGQIPTIKNKLTENNGKRKRQYNVEVDPAKYRRIFDDERGVRYACSICGNVYKWRKSLNKHWKEKHRLENPPPLDAPVPVKDQSSLNSTALNNPVKVISEKGNSNYTILHNRSGSVANESNSNENFLDLTLPPHPAFNIGNTKDYDQIQANHLNSKTLWSTYICNGSNASLNMDKREDFNCADQVTVDDSFSQGDVYYEPLDLSIRQNVNSFHSTDIFQSNDMEDQLEILNSTSDTGLSTHECSDNGLCDNKIYLNSNQTLSNSQKYFICAVCNIKNCSLDSANDHFKNAHVGELEREISGKSPARNTNVAQQNEEWRLSDPNNPLKCVRCDFIGRWPTELQKHAASHSTMRPFKCMICSLTYKWRWDLAKHFDRAHPKFLNPYKKRDRDHAKTVIDQSNNQTSTHELLNKNTDTTDGTRRRKRSYVTSTIQTNTHNDTNEQAELAEEETDTLAMELKQNSDRSGFTCTWCDYQGRWRSELFQHMRCYHAKDKPYHCSNCIYSSNWKWDVQKHVRKQHKSDDDKCEKARVIEIPDKYLFFVTLTEIYIEDVIKDELLKTKLYGLFKRCQSPYTCGHCPHIDISPADFQRHMLIHENIKPYRCFYCDYESKWKSDVKKHMRSKVHAGISMKSHKVKKRRLNADAAEDFLSESSFTNSDVRDDISDDKSISNEKKIDLCYCNNGIDHCYNKSVTGTDQIMEENRTHSLDSWLSSVQNESYQLRESIYSCVACKMNATIFGLYDHFLASHSNLVKIKNTEWICPVCSNRCDNFSDMIHHARTHPDLDFSEDEYMYSILGVWNADSS